MNKNRFVLGVVAGFVLIAAVALFGLKYLSPDEMTPIDFQDIAKAVGVAEMPTLPREWDVLKVEKYDDTFTAPYVVIQYENALSLRLSLSEEVFPDLPKHTEHIGQYEVTVYDQGDRVIYVFLHNDLHYHINCPKEQSNTAMQFIANMR